MFFLVPVLALVLARCAGISMGRFTLPSFFVIAYLASAYAGTLLLYFRLDAYASSLGIRDHSVLFRMVCYSAGGLLLLMSGFVFAHRVVGLSPGLAVRREVVPVTLLQRILVTILFGICCVVLLQYLAKVESIAIVEVLNGDLIAAAIARNNMSESFAGTYWRYHLFFRYLLDYVVVFAFADWFVRRRPGSAILFALSFGVATVSAVMAIEKGPFMKLLVILYLAYVMLKGGRYLQPATKYVASFAVGVLALFYVFFMGIDNLASAVPELLSRIVTGQLNPAYFYLSQFPGNEAYLWGASLPNPGGIFAFDSYPLAESIAHLIWPDRLSLGVVGTAPSVYWAEMHANFGWPGVVISSFLIGVGIYAVAHVLGTLPFSPAVIAATAVLAMHYRTLTGTGLSSYLFDTTAGAIFVVTGAAIIFGNSARRIGSSAARSAADGTG